MGLVRLLPGVVDTANREAPGWNNLVGVTVNGSRSGTLNLTLDGVSSLDTGSQLGPYLAPGLDAIGEVKVLLTNYQAEYGRSSGGTINVVIKNGTRDFHGGGFYFKRHEQFNANEFFNNLRQPAKPRYRFNYWGGNIGGPVIIPGTRLQQEPRQALLLLVAGVPAAPRIRRASEVLITSRPRSNASAISRRARP